MQTYASNKMVERALARTSVANELFELLTNSEGAAMYNALRRYMEAGGELDSKALLREITETLQDAVSYGEDPGED